MMQFAPSADVRGRKYWLRLAMSAILAAGLSLPGPAIAQAPPPDTDQQPTDQEQQPDPPARVGRLSYISGTVSFRTLDEEQWDTAVINYPVTGGLGFWTEPNARATIELSHGAIRMESSTEVDVQQFDDQIIQIGVPQGSINFRLRAIDSGETYRIVTPTGTIQLDQPGRYNVSVVADGSPAKVTVLQGAADILGDGGTVTVTSSEVGDVAPAPPPPTPAAARPQPIDTFSDQQEAAMAQVPNYVSPNIPGIQDTVSQGDWGSSPDYGQVWYPPVQQGWAPYRYGHWAFVPPWGWTWIDDAPWGFAPFHYGRWVEIGPRWAWVPGAVVPQPVYAPALVAFVGGAALAVSFGVGPVVGWIPLGPREVYVPPYGGSINYIRHVNVTNVTNVTVINNTTINNYRSQGADRFVNARGATVVHTNTMTGSAPIRNSTLQADPARFRGVNVSSTAPVRPNLGTSGASRNIVQAAGGSTSAGNTNRFHSAGPKTGTKVYTPTSASSKTGFKTFVPPGGTKSFTPTAGAGTGTGPGPKGNGPNNRKTLTPQGGGATGSTGNSKTTGASTGNTKTFVPQGGGGTGNKGNQKTTGASTGNTKTFVPQGGSTTGSTGNSKSTGASTGNTKTFVPQGGGNASKGSNKTTGSSTSHSKPFTPQGGGSTGSSKSTGTSTGNNNRTFTPQSGSGSSGGSKTTGSTGARTYSPTGSSGSKSTGASGSAGSSGGSRSSGGGGNRTYTQPSSTGGQQKTGSKTGSTTPNTNTSKSGSPPPCNPPHHVVNGKCQ